MARKKILPTETRRQKFLRLPTLRTNEVLSRLTILGNCANRQMCEYTEADIKKIFSAIDKQAQDMKGNFTIIKEREFKL